MRKIIWTALLALPLSYGAVAQETYGELYEKGGLGDITYVEDQMGKLLVANGVPEDCLAKLTFADVGEINLVVGGGDSQTDKETRVKGILASKCN
jgi:hypothetical protein